MPEPQAVSRCLTLAADATPVGCGRDATSSGYGRELDAASGARAPLLGTFNPRAPGYIVAYHDGVDAAAETARLARDYGFTPKFVYERALPGFAALLTDSTVDAIRREPSVRLVEHDGMVTAD